MSSLLVTGANKLILARRGELFESGDILFSTLSKLWFQLFKLMPPMVCFSAWSQIRGEKGFYWDVSPQNFLGVFYFTHLVMKLKVTGEIIGVALNGQSLVYKRHGVNEADGITFSRGLHLYPVFRALKPSGQQLSLTTVDM